MGIKSKLPYSICHLPPTKLNVINIRIVIHDVFGSVLFRGLNLKDFFQELHIDGENARRLTVFLNYKKWGAINIMLCSKTHTLGLRITFICNNDPVYFANETGNFQPFFNLGAFTAR